MEIVHADVDDIDRIVQLWIDLADGQRQYGSHILASENATQIRESVARYVIGDRLLLAREDGILGLVMFRSEQGRFEQDCSRGVVENLYVVAGARNEGIGSELLAAAESQLAEAGVDTVTLDVMATNEDARRFYREHGYDSHRVELERPLDGSDSSV